MQFKSLSQRDRSNSARMHHRKQKNASSSAGAVGKSIGRRESGMETMARLRYLNKKPLCLQYNVANSAHSRRHTPNVTAKRKEQSFLVVIVCGLCRLVQTLVSAVQKATIDFLATPAHELFPNESTNRGRCFGAARAPLRRRPAKRIVRRMDVTRMINNSEHKWF